MPDSPPINRQWSDRLDLTGPSPAASDANRAFTRTPPASAKEAGPLLQPTAMPPTIEQTPVFGALPPWASNSKKMQAGLASHTLSLWLVSSLLPHSVLCESCRSRAFPKR